MNLQTGKLYWMKGIGFWDEQHFSPELIVITGISRERDIISFYQINRGRRYKTSLLSFRAAYILSPT